MQIRLTRKLANYLDGVDVSRLEPGDIADLPGHDAMLLVAEGWAVPLRRRADQVRAVSTEDGRAVAADCSKRNMIDAVGRARRRLEPASCEPQERRRAEDRIRDELHDSHSKTITPKG